MLVTASASAGGDVEARATPAALRRAPAARLGLNVVVGDQLAPPALETERMRNRDGLAALPDGQQVRRRSRCDRGHLRVPRDVGPCRCSPRRPSASGSSTGLARGESGSSPPRRRSLSAGFALLVAQLLGRIWPRERPFMAHPSAHVWGSRSQDPSFPSDHASAAFAIALTSSSSIRSSGSLFVAAAAVVAVGRVVVGAHYPADVLAGMLVAFGSAAPRRSAGPAGDSRSRAPRRAHHRSPSSPPPTGPDPRRSGVSRNVRREMIVAGHTSCPVRRLTTMLFPRL